MILYFKEKTSSPNDIDWGNVSHSAHVLDVDSETKAITKVKSKWGKGGLYEHHPDVVPTTYTEGNSDPVKYIVMKAK